MIIHDLDIPGVPVSELERDPPRPAGGDGPVPAACSAQAMKAYRREARQIFQALGLIKQPQPPSSQCFIEA